MTKSIVRIVFRSLFYSILLGSLTYIIYFDKASYINLHKLKQETIAIAHRVDEYNKENKKVQGKITALQNGPELIEKIAREKYGMQKKNEKVFRFVPAKD